jgi:hypothetical protein
MLAGSTAFLASERRVAKITTSGAPATLIDISGNPNHDTLSGGHSYGLWVDGSCSPYVGDDGNTYVVFPSSENYRIQVGSGGWTSGAAWTGAALVYDSPRLAAQSEYANRIWIFGTHAVGSDIYAIGHMEWYQTMVADDGIAGFNGYVLTNRRWVNSPTWLKSTDNGATWAIKATAADRSIMTPEPWGVQSRDTLYGFRHPSNIVKEGAYYYCFIDYVSLPGGTDLLDSGCCLVRVDDLESSTSWQYWNGTGWTNVSRLTYQGNLSSQQPYMFFKATGWDPYAGTNPGTNRMAQSVRWHPRTKQWLVFGFKGNDAGVVCMTRSKTLANPQFENYGPTFFTLGVGDVAGNYTSNHYMSVFDPDTATDQNFTDIGDSPICITASTFSEFKRNTLSLTVV